MFVDYVRVDLLKRQDLQTKFAEQWQFQPHTNFVLINGTCFTADELLTLHRTGELAKLPLLVSLQQQTNKQDSLNARLKRLVSSHQVMIFIKGKPSAPQCGFTGRLINLLNKYSDVSYGYFNIVSDAEVREGLKAYSNWPTYP